MFSFSRALRAAAPVARAISNRPSPPPPSAMKYPRPLELAKTIVQHPESANKNWPILNKQVGEMVANPASADAVKEAVQAMAIVAEASYSCPETGHTFNGSGMSGIQSAAADSLLQMWRILALSEAKGNVPIAAIFGAMSRMAQLDSHPGNGSARIFFQPMQNG